MAGARGFDAYAIAVGSSHCEPMLRSNPFEWTENFEHEYGVKPGEWRYDTNGDKIRRYWEDRVKPAEMEIQFAMDLAWNVDAWPPQKAHEYARTWAAKIFGKEFAEPIAKIKRAYYRLAQAGKPEHLGALTLTADEAAARLKEYQAIAKDADALNEQIPESLRDPYFQLILYPVMLSTN
jgi:hypothetical protein